MNTQTDNPVVVRLNYFSRVISIIIILFGILAIIGWIFDIQTLKSILPNLVAIKINTALSFLLSGLSLWLLSRQKILPRLRIVAYICAFIVALIGLLTFSQYLFGWNLGIDQLLWQESVAAVGTSHPGRMAPTTALNFLMLGVALLLLEKPSGIRASQSLVLLSLLIGFLNFTGYVYGVKTLYGVASYTQMAVHTAVAFVILSLGMLFANAEHWLMDVITSRYLGGITARRLLIIAIIIPFTLSWLVLLGKNANVYSREFAFALMSLSTIIIFTIIIWWNAYHLNRSDINRTEAEVTRNKLNQELEYQAKQLESSNKELESFSYSVSHDLRAPLRAISGFSQILTEDYSHKLDDEGKRVLGVITQNVKRMGQLIDDLLNFSRIGKQPIGIAPIDIEQITREASEELKPIMTGRKIEIIRKELPITYGDRLLIRQVVQNLLSNAIKFTSTREKAVIEIGGEEGEKENTYYVKDNGVGFDMQYVHKLFGVFQRLHKADEFEGTGVGLAIIQRIINRHGGRIWAEGRVDHGATFYFTLPQRQKFIIE